jgi:hypothetical protein
MANPQLDLQALAKAIVNQYNLSTEDIEELAVQLLRRKQVLLENIGAVASGQYGTGTKLCPRCGRPL